MLRVLPHTRGNDVGTAHHRPHHRRKAWGTTAAENLALACTLCNSRKGSDLTSIDEQTGAIEPLFRPHETVGLIISSSSGAASSREPPRAAPRRDCCGLTTRIVSRSANSSSPLARSGCLPRKVIEFLETPR